MPEMNFLQDLLVLFGLGILAVVTFHRFNLPPVLGFLLTGIICGPYGFKLVDGVHEVEALAELGVVLLLFTIGIEFSFQKLKELKRFLLIGGGLQVGLTLGAAALVSMLFGLSWSVSVFIGMLLSLSSTVIVVRTLQHRGEIDSTHGLTAITILVFQDLCIVPMVLMTPFLGTKGGDLSAIPWMLGKALLLVVLAVSVARYLVPWLLNHVANTRKREAFVLSIMLLCLGTGWATSQVGLSMALGAFLAGLVISESKFNHQALSELIPFRELFNFLVFVSIGMLFDVRTLLSEPWLIVAALGMAIFIKAIVASVVVMALGHSLRVGLLTGLALAQVSEFSFVLAKVGLADGVMSPEVNQLFMAVAILSMAITPLLFAAAPHLTKVLERVLPESIVNGRINPTDGSTGKLTDHVIVVGYGLNGRTLAEVLAKNNIKYIIIDMDPQVVRAERRKGLPIFYGDASSASVLEHAGIDHAKVVAITTSDSAVVLRSAELARRLNSKVAIVARARFADELPDLLKVGVDEVAAEEFSGAVDVFTKVLRRYEVTEPDIHRCVTEVKQGWADNCGPAAPGPCLPEDKNSRVD